MPSLSDLKVSESLSSAILMATKLKNKMRKGLKQSLELIKGIVDSKDSWIEESKTDVSLPLVEELKGLLDAMAVEIQEAT